MFNLGHFELKAVAVDEDGTFLLPGGTSYDKPRFRRVFSAMQEQGVRFCVATGNQVFQVRDYFSEVADSIGYVTSNGSFVFDGTRPLRAVAAQPEVVQHMVDLIHKNPEVQGGLVGSRGTYVEKGAPQWVLDDTELYTHSLIVVDSFSDIIDDECAMFSLFVPTELAESFMVDVRDTLQGALIPVNTGSMDDITYVDVIQPGITKADGLRVLLSEWGIDPIHLAAFGDSENDIEMLELAGVSFAMENAMPSVKERAAFVAPSNAESGVLTVLEELLGI